MFLKDFHIKMMKSKYLLKDFLKWFIKRNIHVWRLGNYMIKKFSFKTRKWILINSKPHCNPPQNYDFNSSHVRLLKSLLVQFFFWWLICSNLDFIAHSHYSPKYKILEAGEVDASPSQNLFFLSLSFLQLLRNSLMAF